MANISEQTLTAPLTAGTWTVNPSASELGFRTKLMGFLPVRGRFSGIAGELRVSAEQQVDGELTIDVETLSTGIRKRDAHLRTKDFFEVEVYPHMQFELTSITPLHAGEVTVRGTLQARGRAVDINAPAQLRQNGAGLELETEFVIDHHAVGFAFKRLPPQVRVLGRLVLSSHQ